MSGYTKTNNYIIRNPIFLALVSPLVALFLILCWNFNLTQDDAFITFRYAENFVNGKGLVWNIGEKVEGYTNFFWLIALILFKRIGVEYLFAAKTLGILASCGTIALTAALTTRIVASSSHSRALIIISAVVAALLISVNYSFVYWSVAGLETALFTFLCLSAFMAYFQRTWLIVPILALAVLTRPEGILLALFFPLFRALETRAFPKKELVIIAVTGILMAPYLIFKWSYYGSVVPNTFYAKTGWDFEQLSSGMEYSLTFLREYTLFGSLFVVIAFRYKRLSEAARALALFAVLYSLYIVLIGGDVLKVNRFFLPILAPLYIALVCALISIPRWKIAFTVVLPIVIVAQLYLPYNHVETFRRNEQGLIENLNFTVAALQNVDPSAFTLATSTIGMVGYALNEHIVYDMVGLTDSVVARHSQNPVEGMATTWRERKYNAEYILAQAPDYILFSTGRKPSSPGERALFLYPAFLNNYRTLGFYSIKTNQVMVIYKRMNNSLGRIKRTVPVQFVQFYNRALNELNSRNFREALRMLDSARAYSPDPIYPYIHYLKGLCFASIGRTRLSLMAVQRSLELDSTLYESHAAMYRWLFPIPELRDRALLHRSSVERLTPWYIRQLDESVRSRK